jgi:Flp pilus assembly pilin Flp
MCKYVRRFWNDENGLTVVEYALLLAFIGAAIAAGTSSLGGAVLTVVTTACTSVGGC